MMTSRRRDVTLRAGSVALSGSQGVNDLPSPLARPLKPHERAGHVTVADGVAQVLERTASSFSEAPANSCVRHSL